MKDSGTVAGSGADMSVADPINAGSLAAQYERVRRWTEYLCEPLEVEDYILQSMPDASPVKWHLAHSSWFFETFILRPHLPEYRPFHDRYQYLFNSYYNAIGERWPRPQRGLLSRPTVADIYRYRAHVDEQMAALLQPENEGLLQQIGSTIVLGLNHEQQHQELIVTDLKHALSANPLHPVYRAALPESGEPASLDWVAFDGGLVWVGRDGDGFCFDNELPRHRVFVGPFRLASRMATNEEYLAFMADGGYERPEFWLSDGWSARQTQGWNAPLYWRNDGSDWDVITLAGRRPLNPAEPVCHICYYEADAFARWAGGRLPTEAEWEIASSTAPVAGHFLEGERFHPAVSAASDDQGPLFALFGDCWQWTSSPYIAYPGYQPAAGALGEYNGKFMCNQMVLRGASCATPRTHARRTYRNFFSPDARWQFTSVRLAQDLE